MFPQLQGTAKYQNSRSSQLFRAYEVAMVEHHLGRDLMAPMNWAGRLKPLF